MPLTDVKARNLKPKDKDYKIADEKGLFLLVKKNGSKYWRLKYRINGSEKLLALGVYP
ncbi:MAG: Arm DNA-binding domain-containing protein [Methylococcales bacterium]